MIITSRCRPLALNHNARLSEIRMTICVCVWNMCSYERSDWRRARHTYFAVYLLRIQRAVPYRTSIMERQKTRGLVERFNLLRCALGRRGRGCLMSASVCGCVHVVLANFRATCRKAFSVHYIYSFWCLPNKTWHLHTCGHIKHIYICITSHAIRGQSGLECFYAFTMLVFS